MKNIFFILIIISSLLSYSEFNTNIFISKDTKPLGPTKLHYGLFFEFLGDWMYGPTGIWAQEINDRGFDHADGGGRLWVWTINANRDLNSVLLDGGYNENGNYYIELSSDVSVEQDVYVTEDLDYEFYIYGKAEEESSINVELLKGNEIIFDQEIEVKNGDWQKYTLDLKIPKDIYQVKLKLSTNSSNNVSIDEASLIPQNNVLGVRKEFDDLITYMNPGIIRYPGGGFADQTNNNWRLAVGDIDKRLSPNRDFRGLLQRMDFGYDEFINYCKFKSIEPYIVVNFINDFDHTIVQNARDLLEYCNGPNESEYGSLRKLNTSNDPYNIVYWELGNEMYFVMPDSLYNKRFREMYNEMIKVESPEITFISNGDMWIGKENFDNIINGIGDIIDQYGYHPSIERRNHFPGTEIELFELYTTNANWMLGEYLNKLNEWIDESDHPDVKSTVTEWWTYSDENYSWQDTARHNNSIQSAIANASNLLEYQKNPDKVDFATRTLQLGLIDKYVDEKGKRFYLPNCNLDALALITNHSGDKNHIYDLITEDFIYQNDSLWMNVPANYLETNVTSDNDSVYITLINRNPIENTNVFINFDSLGVEKEGKLYSLISKDIHSYRRDSNTADVYLENRVIDDVKNLVIKNGSVNVLSIKKSDLNSIDNTIKDIYFYDGLIYLPKNTDSYQFYIYNLNGSLVNEARVLNKHIDVKDLKPGVYFLNLIENEKVANFKFIIN